MPTHPCPADVDRSTVTNKQTRRTFYALGRRLRTHPHGGPHEVSREAVRVGDGRHRSGRGAALTGCSAGDIAGGDDEGGDNTLTFLVDNGEDTIGGRRGARRRVRGLARRGHGNVETRPQGAEGDNVVKTRLSTGDMTDVFMYNAGLAVPGHRPRDEPGAPGRRGRLRRLEESFLETVTAGDELYGAPFGTAQGGGIMYNRAVYDKLGLQVPKTWDEFMANNPRSRRPARRRSSRPTRTPGPPSCSSSATSTTSRPPTPSGPSSTPPTRSSTPTNPAAIEGFEHLQEVQEAGYLNEDFASANLDDGLDQLADGDGVHYPMLSGALPRDRGAPRTSRRHRLLRDPRSTTPPTTG